jgi:uncharacterized beta-barrel protein YwiB (DUF1934 family)
MQKIEEDDEQIQLIVPGKYQFRDNRHYLLYEEMSDDCQDVIKTMIKIQDGRVEIIKKGIQRQHLLFEEKRPNIGFYDTPFGMLEVGTSTDMIDIEMQEDSMEVAISYALEINGQYISDNYIRLQVESQMA